MSVDKDKPPAPFTQDGLDRWQEAIHRSLMIEMILRCRREQLALRLAAEGLSEQAIQAASAHALRAEVRSSLAGLRAWFLEQPDRHPAEREMLVDWLASVERQWILAIVEPSPHGRPSG